MRRVAEENGVRVKAYSGTTGVLLAFDVEDGRRQDLLGFAISRETLSGRQTGRLVPLQGILDFPGTSKGRGELVATNVAPIQKFRWSDYCVYPGVTYGYTVNPVYRSGNQPVTAQNRRTYLQKGPRVEVATQDFEAEDAVIFNRAVASSQAFSRRFPDLDAEIEAERLAGTLGDKTLPQRALDWLSRGLVERIERFLEMAVDHTWSVDLAIYEYHLPRLHDAMVQAGRRGAQVRVLYHDRDNDETGKENRHLLNNPPIPNAVLFPRRPYNLMHNKFVLLNRIDAAGSRSPVAVLAGSTNWTENGCYRQANVVHTSRTPAILEAYAEMFETLVQTHADRKATKRWINKNNVIPNSPERFAGFSPRGKLADIESLEGLIEGAERDVFFATAFSLHARIRQALMGEGHDQVLRMGIENKRSSITGFHRDRTAMFTAASLLPGGLEGWLKESSARQRGSIRVHTKLILLDATSDIPLIISGSHNYSANASGSNDENYLIIRRDQDLADTYLCELMRVYDHYRFRFAAKERGKAGSPTAPPSLSGDDSWAAPYFVADSMKRLDRLRFAGR